MNATPHIRRFDYQVAEEVVVRLDGVAAFDLASAREIPAHLLPPWTIADITARLDRGDAERYAIRFRHGYATCIAAVPVTSIEGTA